MSAEPLQRAPVPNALRLGPRARRLIRSAARVVNPLVLRFAGARHVPVLGGDGAAEIRAVGFRFGAGRDHVLEGAGQIGDSFRPGVRDVRADLPHGLDGERVDADGMGARAQRLEAVGRELAKPGFGHLAARGVADANEENPGLPHGRMMANGAGAHKARSLYTAAPWTRRSCIPERPRPRPRSLPARAS